MKVRRIPTPLALALVATFSILAGCTDYMRGHLGGGPGPHPDNSHAAYYGTGVVTKVRISGAWREAWVDFSSQTPPHEHQYVMLIRTNTFVGRALVADASRVFVVLGTPEVGDKVIGIQNEERYQRQKP